VDCLEGRYLLSGFGHAVMHPDHLVLHCGLEPTGFSSPDQAGFMPPQIRHAYGFDQITLPGGAVGDGNGQTIAIVDAFDDPNIGDDLQQFDAQFGLPDPPQFIMVAQDGSSNLPDTDPGDPNSTPPRDPGSWELETALDVEWAHAIAPGANILLVEASSPAPGDLYNAVQYAESQPGVSVVSMSFGGSEDPSESSSDGLFLTPQGHSGITFVASSGDYSAPAEYPAFSPNVLSVGGTVLTTDPQGNYQSEDGWSGSGGGTSQYEPTPGYQSGLGVSMRANPDVAYNSGTPDAKATFAVYDTYNQDKSSPWEAVYGTSAGAPQWAGLIAIANQGRHLANLAPLDGASQTLPLLYKMSANDFHDITTGNNGFAAGPGYDLVTGRGSPVANLVVADLGGSSPDNGLFTIDNGVLTVHGKVLGMADETITIDGAQGVVQVTVNGKTSKFDHTQVPQGIHVIAGDGNVTVNVESNPGGLLVTIDDGSGADFVNISPNAHFLGNFYDGDVTVHGGGGSDTLAFFDQADPYDDVRYGVGVGGVDIHGPTFDYAFFYDNMTEVDLIGGSGSDTYGVGYSDYTPTVSISPGTGSNTLDIKECNGTLNINPTDPSYRCNTVNVGLSGSVKYILGTINIDTMQGYTALTVDDSADSVPSTVTLDTFINGYIWGSIAGLGQATINYQYIDTVNVTLDTGEGQTVDVMATGVPTFLTTAKDCTVAVGKAGSVKDIKGTLTLDGPLSKVPITVNDSADTIAHTVTLNTFQALDDIFPWGSITGLAPKPINFKCADTRSLTVETGPSDHNVIDVLNHRARFSCTKQLEGFLSCEE
jgi:hypothetical protein